LAAARDIGHEGIEADALAQLGMAARDEGRLDDASEMLREAIRIDYRRGAVSNVATNLGRLASIRMDQEHLFLAARLLGAQEGLLAHLGSKPFWWVTERREEAERLMAERIGRALLSEELAAGRALSLEEAVELALRDLPGVTSE